MSDTILPSGTSIHDLTVEDFKTLYYEALLTENQIAKRYASYQVAVNRFRNKHKLPTLGKTGRIENQLPDLTVRQEELLVGSLLGDGTMSAPSPRTARFGEGHSPKQAEYTNWKGEILGAFVSNFYEATKVDRETGKIFKSWCVATKTTTKLRRFYDLFYKTGARVFPASLPKLLTPFALAVWYMDDGNAGANHPTITFGLDDTSLDRALRALRKLGLHPDLRRYAGETTWTITFPGQSYEFYALVDEHIPECMAYKRQQQSARTDMLWNAKKLTAETAVRLYQGGMTYEQIAELFNVGRSTVSRRLEAGGVRPGALGRPQKRRYTSNVAALALAKYTGERWAALSEGEQSRWVEEIFTIQRAVGFPFPDAPSAMDVFGKLQEKEVGLEDGAIRPRSYVGNDLCQAFFPHRYKASWRGNKSAFESWHRDDDLRWAIRFQLKVGDPVAPHRVLRALSMRWRTPSVFRALVAKYLYQTYCPEGGKVYDPCAGYGGRLLGAAAAGVEYLGTDVDLRTVEGNRSLAQAIGYSCDVVEAGAESFDPGKVDFIFTSPPYFDAEQYSRSEGQSYKKYPTLDAWLAGFMRPLIETAYKSLDPGKALALNIADTKDRKQTYPLVQSTIDLAIAVGFQHETTLKMPLSALNRAKEDAWEPILVFRR